MNSRDGKIQREEKREEKGRREKEKESEEEDTGVRKVRKVAKHIVFSMICSPGGSQSRLAKAAGAEPSGQMRHEPVYAVVARSTFPGQNAQSTAASDHFWKFGRRRVSGARHISKSKCTNNTILGPPLKDQMLKKCRPLWREVRFQVKM